MIESRVARIVQGTGRLCGAVGAVLMLALGVLVVVGVVLRMSGVALPGRSEISQLLIVVVASTSLIVATAVNGHASVHLFVDRLGDTGKRRIAAVAAGLGVIYWTIVAYAALIVLIDNTRQVERTELLHVSVAPFRAFWVASLFAVAMLLLARLIWPKATQESK